MNGYSEGRAAFRDGAPCPKDAEEKRGWLAAWKEYHEFVLLMNHPPTDSSDEISWWEYLAIKGEYARA